MTFFSPHGIPPFLGMFSAENRSDERPAVPSTSGFRSCVLLGHGFPLEGIGHTHSPLRTRVPMDAETQACPSRFWSGWQEVKKRALWLLCYGRCQASWISAVNRYNIDKVQGFGTSQPFSKNKLQTQWSTSGVVALLEQKPSFSSACVLLLQCVCNTSWTDVISVLFFMLSSATSPRATSTELLSPDTNLKHLFKTSFTPSYKEMMGSLSTLVLNCWRGFEDLGMYLIQD